MSFVARLEAIASKRSETNRLFTYSPSSQEAISAADIDLLIRLEAQVFCPLFVRIANAFTSGVLSLASRVELLNDAAQLESTAMYGPDRIVIVANIPRVGSGSITMSVKSHGPVHVCQFERKGLFEHIRGECEARVEQQIQDDL